MGKGKRNRETNRDKRAAKKLARGICKNHAEHPRICMYRLRTLDGRWQMYSASALEMIIPKLPRAEAENFLNQLISMEDK